MTEEEIKQYIIQKMNSNNLSEGVNYEVDITSDEINKINKIIYMTQIADPTKSKHIILDSIIKQMTKD